MDFNMKKLASDAGIFFTRAVQLELSWSLDNLLRQTDCEGPPDPRPR